MYKIIYKTSNLLYVWNGGKIYVNILEIVNQMALISYKLFLHKPAIVNFNDSLYYGFIIVYFYRSYHSSTLNRLKSNWHNSQSVHITSSSLLSTFSCYSEFIISLSFEFFVNLICAFILVSVTWNYCKFEGCLMLENS